MKFTQEQGDFLAGIIDKWQEVHFTRNINTMSQGIVDGAIKTLKFIVRDIITKSPDEIIEVNE